MSPSGRRLCVFFSAGATRYAIDATQVIEVLRAQTGAELKLPQHIERHDLAALLGGDEEPQACSALVIDTTPTVALRLREIDGVYDAAALSRWPVQGRLVPLLAPVISAVIEHEGRLVFELDAERTTRGLPKQVKGLERHLREADQALVFDVQGETLAVPLHHVAQVIETGSHFNLAPNAGAFLGVVQHRGQLAPVFTPGAAGSAPALVHPYVVLCTIGSELIGLAASSVAGVRRGGVPTLDVARMFS